ASHKTAPIELRERLAFPEDTLPDALRQVVALPGVSETCILSTCNRVEIVARAEGSSPDVSSALKRFLAESHGMSSRELDPHVYCLEQRAAIHHVFRVASSLDSMVVGEAQILGQVKDAHALARSVGTLRGPLDEVLTRSFFVAKRVRTETGIASSAVSVSYAAVELAKKIFGSLAGKRLLLVGAGKMSELAARHLLGQGETQVFVTNRTPERANEMASALQGRAVPFEQLLEYAAQCDILICSTSAPEFLIRKADAQRLLAERKNRPMFLIDIAVPRNIDPEVNKLDNVFLYDVDDLQQVVNANRKERLREAQKGEQIVEQETDKFLRWLKTLDVIPTIIDLQTHLEQIRQQEIARVRSQLGDLTPEQRQAIEALTKGLVHKVLHSPITELKTLAQQPDGLRLVEVVRRMFNLKP
ncbi:MAG TPA: glutamyl-tRNA reductase, partial [Terriglobia bacterium]|nr:glutamyl-tRNA reductase [Terriglobia bacterium]